MTPGKPLPSVSFTVPNPISRVWGLNKWSALPKCIQVPSPYPVRLGALVSLLISGGTTTGPWRHPSFFYVPSWEPHT